MKMVIANDGEFKAASDAGAREVTISVLSESVPVTGASLSIKSDDLTALIAGPSLTDINGRVVFYLDGGSYKVVIRSSPRYATRSPVALVVSSDATLEIDLTPMAIAPSSDIALCDVHGWIATSKGQPLVGVAINFQLVTTGAVAASGRILQSGFMASAVTDENGYFSIDLARDDEITALSDETTFHWRVSCAELKINETIVVSDSSKDLTDLLTPTPPPS